MRKWWDDNLYQWELDEVWYWNEFGRDETSRLVKGLESFLGLIMDSLLGTCNFGMLGIKVSFDYSTIVAVLAFVSFLGTILLCVLESRHHLLIKLWHGTRHGA